MEFITVEQFKEQPSEVQKVFLDWWNNIISEYDLVQDENRVMLYKDYLERGCIENDSYPLFTEGQLRKFIEDKLNIKVQSMFDLFSSEYALLINAKGNMLARTGTEDLLQAYWKVACSVAKEGFNG